MGDGSTKNGAEVVRHDILGEASIGLAPSSTFPIA